MGNDALSCQICREVPSSQAPHDALLQALLSSDSFDALR